MYIYSTLKLERHSKTKLSHIPIQSMHNNSVYVNLYANLIAAKGVASHISLFCFEKHFTK